MSGIVTKNLSNGMSCSIYSFPQLETVGISVGVRYGSVDENPNINGSAHFLEHMTFKGTARRTWKDINEQTKDIGAYSNATTDREMTNYIMQVHKSYVEKALDLMSDMAFNSKIPKDEMELERGPIINENLIWEDNPSYLFYDYIPMLLFKGNPAGMRVGGDNNRTIKKITRDHLFNIYKGYYTPRNMHISISGGISESRAHELAEKYFGLIKTGTYNRTKRKPFNGKRAMRKMVIKKHDIKQMKVGIGFVCTPFGKERLDELASMVVANEIIQYRVYEEIREKRGLSYDPQSSYVAGMTYGMLSVEAGTEPKNGKKVKDILLATMQEMHDGEITKAEVLRMKNAVVIRQRTARERSLDMAIKLTMSSIIDETPNLPERMPKIISEVSLDSVRKYTRKNIDCDHYGMIVLKPK